MLRTLSPDAFVRESTQTLEKANHLIATLRISRLYLVFCTVMSILSSVLLGTAVYRFIFHGMDGLRMRVYPSEELMELAVCGGILVEVLWALRLMPLQLFFRVKLLQLDICVFVMASLSAALASANLAEYLAMGSVEVEAADGQDGEREELWRSLSAALFLFRFLLQPTRAVLAMRNALQLSRERKVAMEDIVLPEMPANSKDRSQASFIQMTGLDHISRSSEAMWV
mmetsp:Transcript_28052/g.51214  ORF Transcript_28052/g.51214 Transcript_28052/m.51214 type:complete len:227 (-) Transcript_28052:31-711(-)